MNRKRSLFIVSSVYYALFFMAGGGFVSYIGIWYSSINLPNALIGIISSAGLLAGMLGQPLWGTLADHSKNKTRMLNILNLIAAALIWLVPASHSSFWLILASMIIFSFFGNSLMPIADSITIGLAKREGLKFSTIRLIGSLGFAGMAAVAGKILSLNINYIFAMFFVLRFSGGIVSFFLPVVEGHPREKGQRDSFLDLFQDKRLVAIYAYIFVLSSTMGFFSNFHSIYSRAQGISLELIGVGVMIGSLSQFPFTLFFTSIHRKLGLRLILIISGAVYVLRWFLMSYALNEFTVLWIWALHGCNYIVLYLCLADYVAEYVPARLQTRGQMMNNIVLLGASAVLGGTLGGLLADTLGLQTVFMLCAWLAAAAWLVFVVFSSRLFSDKNIKAALNN